MKCVCGYEKLYDWQTNDGKEIGDEDFIRIDCFGKPFETDKKESDYYGDYENGYMYACPKCMTVKFQFN